MLRAGLILATLLLAGLLAAQPPSKPEPARPKVLIAFASHRERKLHPKVYFYEHDGVSQGRITGSITAVNQRSDYHPAFSADGKLCAFASELENQVGKVQLWDVANRKEVPLTLVNDSPNAIMHPTLTGDGKFLAFAAWNRPGLSRRWDVQLYDLTAKKLLELPGLNSSAFDERMPAFSAAGRWLAYVTNDRDTQGSTDIAIYDLRERKAVRLPAMNSARLEIEPSLSADGNLIAFVSDRPGGAGGRDIYLWDRRASKLLPLPGLNSGADEQSPCLSGDGRYIAFVAERIGGEGERDIYLYDRQAGKLLPTPGLNSRQEDFDPCVIVLPR